MALAAAVGLGVAALLAACGTSQPANRSGAEVDDSMDGPSIEETLEAKTPGWMALAGVEGTGIGRCDGAPCIKVFVRSETDELRAAIPDSVDGHPVRLEVTGRFEPRSPPGDTGDAG